MGKGVPFSCDAFPTPRWHLRRGQRLFGASGSFAWGLLGWRGFSHAEILVVFHGDVIHYYSRVHVTHPHQGAQDGTKNESLWTWITSFYDSNQADRKASAHVHRSILCVLHFICGCKNCKFRDSRCDLQFRSSLGDATHLTTAGVLQCIDLSDKKC